MNTMTLNTPSVLAIRAWLVENRGTAFDIVAATGFGLSTVERAVGILRKAGEPQAANVLKAKKGPPIGISKLEALRRRAERIRAEEAKTAAAGTMIVAAALAARTPLEQVWRQAA